MVTMKYRFDNDDHYTGGNTKQYLILHDTGNKTDSDEGNANYFCTGARNASAHYFVDDDSITQVVKDDDCSWHCGDGGGRFGITNRNSIGIEQCRVNGVVTAKTMQNTLELVVYLMKKYNIPEDRVKRHHDASGKNCPASFNLDGKWTRWFEFKAKLHAILNPPKPTPTPVTPTPSYPTDLPYNVGSKGENVKRVQRFLGITADGIYGNQTKATVLNYQKMRGIYADGIVGKVTWSHMFLGGK